MMIGPETYYEMNLKGKTAEQIKSVIRGLKNEIGHLKNVMERPDYGSEPIMHPNESTRLWCAREYLERAKTAFAEVGGEYKPSQFELKAMEFDNNLSAISKIIFTIGGFFRGDETRTVLLDGEDLKVNVQHSLLIKPEETAADITLPIDKEDFLEELSRLHIGEWRSSYNPERFGYVVLDGTQWELEIHYNNGSKLFKSHGNNSFPYNFDEFQQLIGIDTSTEEDDESIFE